MLCKCFKCYVKVYSNFGVVLAIQISRSYFYWYASRIGKTSEDKGKIPRAK